MINLRQVPLAPLQKGAPKTNFVAVPFALTAQGEYPQLMDLLRRLEGGEHYCRIISADLKPLTEIRGGQMSLALNLELMAIQ